MVCGRHGPTRKKFLADSCAEFKFPSSYWYDMMLGSKSDDSDVLFEFLKRHCRLVLADTYGLTGCRCTASFKPVLDVL